MKEKNVKQRIVVFALLLSIINLVIAVKSFYDILYITDDYFPIITVTIMQIINIIISARLILKKQNISPKKEKNLIILLLILLFITFFIPVKVDYPESTHHVISPSLKSSTGIIASYDLPIDSDELHENIYNFILWSKYRGIFYYLK